MRDVGRTGSSPDDTLTLEQAVAAGARLAGDPDRDRVSVRLAASSSGAALDRLVGLAARLLGTPSAQLSLLTDVQLIAGGTGAAGASVGTRGPLAESLCTVTAASGGPLVVVDALSDARVADLPPVTSGAVGAYLGVPVRSRDHHVVGALCTFGPAARTWSEADIAVLDELAAAAASELELSALSIDYEADRLRWELAMVAGGVGTFDLDLRTDALVWDDRLVELFGYDRSTFDGTLDAFVARVHPDDRDRVRHAMDEAAAVCGDFEAEYRILLPSGITRWVQARGAALPGRDGTAARLLGAAYDTTAGRESDARVSRVLETMSAAFYSVSPDWRFTYVNAQAERLLGRRRDELLGGSLWELFPAALGSEFETRYRHAAATGESIVFEAYYPTPLDGWYEMRVWPSPDGLSVYFLDVTARRAAQRDADAARQSAEDARRSAETDRRRAEEALAETVAASRRLALLARVSADLGGTLDAEAALTRLSRHVVPELAEWCLLTLVDEHGGLQDVGEWHADPAMRPVLSEYARLRLSALDPVTSFVARAIATGRPAIVPAPAADGFAGVLRSEPARELIHRLAPQTAAVLPLRARGRTRGLLTLARGVGQPPLDGPDLMTAIEVTERAGLALDNARLYGAQQRIAEGLQRSLLTAPVRRDDIEVAVRYQPAAAAARVGGDWYDSFVQPDGGTVLVIGDVMGHDVDAAASMSQVRSVLRGIAYATGGSPASILTTLDAAMDDLLVETTATAVVARLEPGTGDLSAATLLRWSNAGHPPPMVVSPDGTVTALSGSRNDLLLGISPEWERLDQQVALERGSTVLLYTDGLVERRGEHLEDGIARLRGALVDLAGSTPDDLADGVLARMLPGPPDDDVALVAVRVLGPPPGPTA